MSKTKTESERKSFLSSLGLNPDAPALRADEPAKVTVQTSVGNVVLAPPGVDPRAMPVDEIIFDERLLDEFPSLTGDELAEASRKVFAAYKSYTKGDRNKALHRKVSTFITTTRRKRQTGGMVKEQVKTTREQRDIAALIASEGVGASELAEALLLLKTQKEAK